MNRSYMSLFILALTVPIVFSSCSKSEVKDSSGMPPIEKVDPVTLKVMFNPSLTEVFQTYVDPALKEKLPHITVEYVTSQPKLEEMVTSGSVPDIVMPNGDMFPYLDVGLLPI